MYIEGGKMIQLYYGDGKGKTSACVGAAVRAAGAGHQVLFVQFYKDGSSAENQILKNISGVECLFPTEQYDLLKKPDAKKITALKGAYATLLETAEARAADTFMIVLDEGADAFEQGLLPAEAFLNFLKIWGQKCEIVLSGHTVSTALTELCDYISHVKNIKHPFEKKVAARKGIEY